METINVRHQNFLASFSFCGLAEVDLTLAALNRAFPLLSADDQEKLSGFLDGFQAFALSGSDQQEEDFFDELSEYEEACPFD
jgi:hypothetical protein